MMNQIERGPNLAVVVMPLVRLLNTGALCWADKEEVCRAISRIVHTHAEMKREAEHLAGVGVGYGSNACGQQQ